MYILRMHFFSSVFLNLKFHVLGLFAAGLLFWKFHALGLYAPVCQDGGVNCIIFCIKLTIVHAWDWRGIISVRDYLNCGIQMMLLLFRMDHGLAFCIWQSLHIHRKQMDRTRSNSDLSGYNPIRQWPGSIAGWCFCRGFISIFLFTRY